MLSNIAFSFLPQAIAIRLHERSSHPPSILLRLINIIVWFAATIVHKFTKLIRVLGFRYPEAVSSNMHILLEMEISRLNCDLTLCAEIFVCMNLPLWVMEVIFSTPCVPPFVAIGDTKLFSREFNNIPPRALTSALVQKLKEKFRFWKAYFLSCQWFMPVNQHVWQVYAGGSSRPLLRSCLKVARARKVWKCRPESGGRCWVKWRGGRRGEAEELRSSFGTNGKVLSLDL